MNKIPSTNFYFDNFRGGCALMSYEEKGRYIELLGLQAIIYPRHIPSEMFYGICGGSTEVFSKFAIDDEGKFFNVRMKKELDKSYSKSERAKQAVNRRWDNVNTNDDTNVHTNVSTFVNTNDDTFNNMKDDNNYLNNNINNNSVSENESNNTPVVKSPKANNSLKSPIVANWRTSFEIYRAEEESAYNALLSDAAWMATLEKHKKYPNLNIKLSLEKSHVLFWSTEAGWKHKKSKRAAAIDWKRTFTNALEQRFNQVFDDNRQKCELTFSEAMERDRLAAQAQSAQEEDGCND